MNPYEVEAFFDVMTDDAFVVTLSDEDPNRLYVWLDDEEEGIIERIFVVSVNMGPRDHGSR